MGMVAYYARVSREELELLKSNPDDFWQLPEMSWNLDDAVEPAASECLYIDKDWLILSWLCSPVGRAEERNQTALMRASTRRANGEPLEGEAFTAAMIEESEALGFTYTDASTLPDDPVLTAIQGRRQGDDGATIADLGAVASAFDPQEVSKLASALNALRTTELRENFDVAEMDQLGLPTDGEESELDEFLLPQVERVKALYNRALAAGQFVVVVIS